METHVIDRRQHSRREIVDLSTHADPFVTVDELAGYWRVSTDTIYRDIDKGALRVFRIGRLIRIAILDARTYGQPSDAPEREVEQCCGRPVQIRPDGRHQCVVSTESWTPKP